MNIHLGYELGTGHTVTVPLAHTAVTGQTQASGKTTTLEALIHRSQRRAIAFLTKRGEGTFQTMVPVPPYFAEAVDWVLVKGLLEATAKTKLKFETSWIIEVSKGARNLQDVQDNIHAAMYPKKVAGAKPRRVSPLAMSVYTVLSAYLELLLPQIAALKYEKTLRLEAGLNVMDLTPYSLEMQGLVVRSVLQWVYEKEKNVIVVIPEAWELLPEQKGSPVRDAAEIYIRKGAVLGNYLFLDSQDLAGVNKAILRQVGVWILGVQREANEVMRTLKQFISKPARPKPDDLMSLGKGQFFVCHGTTQRTVYVQPHWMNGVHARAIAVGDESVESGAAVFRDYLKQFKKSAREQPETVPDGGEYGEVAGQRSDKTTETEATEIRDPHDSVPSDRFHPPVSGERTGATQTVAVPNSDGLIHGRCPESLTPEKTPMRTKVYDDFESGMELQVPVESSRKRATADGIDAIWPAIRRRILSDPQVLAVVRTSPEIRILERPKVLEMDGDTPAGQVAVLIHEGFFAQPRKAYAAFVELVERRKKKFAKPTVYTVVKEIAEMGFLVSDGDGNYTAVVGMKVSRAAAGR